MSTTTEAVTHEDLIYMGRRTGIRGVVYAYRRADEAAPKIDSSAHQVYAKPLASGQAVGSLVRLTHPADQPDSYYSRGPHAPLLLAPADVAQEVLLAWQVQDRAAYERKAQEDRYKRAMKQHTPLEDTLAELERAARSLSTADRAAFARYVADRLRGAL